MCTSLSEGGSTYTCTDRLRKAAQLALTKIRETASHVKHDDPGRREVERREGGGREGGREERGRREGRREGGREGGKNCSLYYGHP